MLRVGLTGDLGSGKSTVARLLAERGAVVLSSDEMGRALMQPGQAVYEAIVRQFGPAVVAPDGMLNRSELARLAFGEGRVEELNAIVHPAVLAEQERVLAALAREQPDAVVVVESALIFTTTHGVGEDAWRDRFDRIVMVNAPEAVKVERFVQRTAAGRALPPEERAALEAEARRRLAAQAPARAYEAECLVVRNEGSLDDLARAVELLWESL